MAHWRRGRRVAFPTPLQVVHAPSGTRSVQSTGIHSPAKQGFGCRSHRAWAFSQQRAPRTQRGRRETLFTTTMATAAEGRSDSLGVDGVALVVVKAGRGNLNAEVSRPSAVHCGSAGGESGGSGGSGSRGGAVASGEGLAASWRGALRGRRGEMADTGDLKSPSREGVRVRAPPTAPAFVSWGRCGGVMLASGFGCLRSRFRSRFRPGRAARRSLAPPLGERGEVRRARVGGWENTLTGWRGLT